MRISDWSSDVCSSDLDGQTRCGEHVLQHLRGSLLAIALFIRCFQMPYARQSAGHQYRRKACGENEAGRIGTDDVYDHLVGRDIAAHHPERLAKRTFRSEERRVGKEGVSTGRSRWSAYQ